MSKRPYTIKLSDTDREYLQRISRSRTCRTVDRSRILLQKEKGRTDKDISEGLGVSINTVRLYISKYFEDGVKEVLSDAPRSGHPAVITDSAGHGSSISPASVRRTLAAPRNRGHLKASINIYRAMPSKQGSNAWKLLQRQEWGRS